MVQKSSPINAKFHSQYLRMPEAIGKVKRRSSFVIRRSALIKKSNHAPTNFPIMNHVLESHEPLP